MRDHPRPCGEKVRFVLAQPLAVGSPPPMRGKAALIVRVYIILRITPAHAGKSTKSEKRLDEYQDHPRPCGEKVSIHSG